MLFLRLIFTKLCPAFFFFSPFFFLFFFVPPSRRCSEKTEPRAGLFSDSRNRDREIGSRVGYSIDNYLTDDCFSVISFLIRSTLDNARFKMSFKQRSMFLSFDVGVCIYARTHVRLIPFAKSKKKKRKKNKDIRPIGRNYIERSNGSCWNERNRNKKRQRVTGSPVSEKSLRLSLRVALAVFLVSCFKEIAETFRLWSDVPGIYFSCLSSVKRSRSLLPYLYHDLNTYRSNRYR